MSSERVESLTKGLIESLDALQSALKNAFKQASGQEPDRVPAYYKKATSTLSVGEVKNLLGIDYDVNDPAYILTLKGDEAKDVQLSSWCVEAMSKLMKARHYQLYRGEPFSRILIDLLLCDRLLCLDDSKANNFLQVLAEVDIRAEIIDDQKGQSKAGYVAGRADYALGYKGEKYPEAILIIVEAKKEGCCAMAIPQTLCYLAGLQDARKKAGKLNVDLFGMMADTNEYRFVLLDRERRAFISEPLLWATRSGQIVALVDYILRSAISSSPHTTPIKTKNRRITNYDDHLDKTLQRGAGTSARGGEEDPDEYDIIVEHGISKLVISPSTGAMEE
ncbi:hypothetical protein GP486_005438 [Trichoglossum hirsutum]|uniref:Uncharacterized protein n=1 Tax=Trichoglossum hirsutum TaxID=265104 RepID=A0A9P8L964_9PEZI|nr:hypothetical protein GP486_005438 [Trichoglossum hirsutum]